MCVYIHIKKSVLRKRFPFYDMTCDPYICRHLFSLYQGLDSFKSRSKFFVIWVIEVYINICLLMFINIMLTIFFFQHYSVLIHSPYFYPRIRTSTTPLVPSGGTVSCKFESELITHPQSVRSHDPLISHKNRYLVVLLLKFRHFFNYTNP